jgi:hypothetical protein
MSRGTAWEGVCEESFAILATRRRLTWHPTPVRYTVIRRLPGGEVVVRPRGDGPPDYLLLAGLDPTSPYPSPLPIVADAKEAESAEWKFVNLKQHQADAFDAWEAQGGLALVFLRYAAPGRDVRFVLPWTRLGPLWRRWAAAARAKAGEASLRLVDAPAVGAVWSGADWLTPLRKLLSTPITGRP